MPTALKITLRYALAGFVAFASAFAAVFAFGGNDENYSSPAFIATVGFIAVAAGAFCFPIRLRWFRALVLLCLELLLYCLTKLDPNDDFLQWHPFPCLVPLIYGGLIAVIFHMVIYMLYLVMRRPDRFDLGEYKPNA
ncbi:MAG TPA: hypothetical protein VGN23_04905 [Verrucomicrobiae bacterium]|jgi:hypothetical protein